MPALLTRMSQAPNAEIARSKIALPPASGGDAVVARDRLAAGVADRLHHLVGDARAAGAVGLTAEVVDHHLGAFAAEQERGLAPDPAAGAGDDRYLSIEHAHRSPPCNRSTLGRAAHRRDRRLARGLELVARLPRRQRVGFGDEESAVERQPGVFDHAVVAPRLVELVRGLVVVLARVELGLLAAPLRRPPDEGGAGLEVERRNADLREVELVGAVEVAAIGELVALDGASLQPGDRFDHRVEVRLAVADEAEVGGHPEHVGAVDVDVGGDAAGRDGGVLRVELRAEQALLLAADERDHDRSARRLGQRLERLGDGDHQRHAGRVVARAVVDGVAARVGDADAEVIVVRAVGGPLGGEASGSRPGMTPITFAVVVRRSLLWRRSEVVTPSGTGRKSRDLAP